MIQVYGHVSVVDTLSAFLPPVTLLRGQRGVGKWTVGEFLADHHHVWAADRCMVRSLTADQARGVVSFVRTAPHGPLKFVLARLTGATESALNILLKTLEEPPERVRFVLTASESVLATVSSRAQTYHLGLLSGTDLYGVLTAKLGMTQALAHKAVAHGYGSVWPALSAQENESARTTALSLMGAVAKQDVELFRQVSLKVDDTVWRQLVLFLQETSSGRWRAFTAEEGAAWRSRREDVIRMLKALSRFADVRSRLAVRVALEPFATRR